MATNLQTFVAQNPDAVTTLRAYRDAATRALVKAKNPRSHWTQVLTNDWLVAGPRNAALHGFDRNQWPVLQRLRNQVGPACLGQLDTLLDHN